MKWILRTYLYTWFTFWAAAAIIPGFSIQGGWIAYAMIVTVYILLHIFVRPLIKIILLPLSFATFGLPNLIITPTLLYILGLIFSDIRIQPWKFSGLSWSVIILNPMELNVLSTYILTGLFISGILVLLSWIRS
jgi:uncharacterized membrane protein YvlD (DUF360 family)